MGYWFLSWLDRGWGRAHAKLSRPSRVAEMTGILCCSTSVPCR